MIVGERKPLEEIKGLVAPYRRVLVLGCGACVTVCQAGGEQEVKTLASLLRLASAKEGQPKEVLEGTTTRQCEWEFCEPFMAQVKTCDAVLSMACGVGVNFLATRIGNIPVFPALDTSFYGAVIEHGKWAEMCAGCGECILALTGGVCPVARCAKTIMNGPCGGSRGGKCEISRPGREVDCGWALIVERMKALGTLDKLRTIVPPKNWATGRDGGPRTYVREDLVIQKPAAPSEAKPKKKKKKAKAKA